MKRLILSGLILLFLATTFRSDSSGGWVQQTLPRSDNIVHDIFFHDSLNGWAVANKYPSSDSTFIFVTSNGGANWFTQYSNNQLLISIQFTDLQIGYSAGGTVGGTGKVYKTTNGGVNWNLILTAGHNFSDIFFINSDTGWISDDDGLAGAGVLKTTNGGLNWVQQLNNTYRPLKIFFINKDTGWVGTNEANARLFKTTNGGSNWNLLLSNIGPVQSIFFLNPLKGWIRAIPGSNGISYTTDGGFSWTNSQGDTGGYSIKFINDSIGYTGMVSSKILKSTDGGKNWGHQSSPIYNNLSIAILKSDLLHAWAGGTGIVYTTDGGGPITYVGISPSSTLVPSFKLLQNYPNPFNPSTSIDFEIKKNSRISLRVFSADGREVDELLDYEKFTTGSYYVKYEASNRLASGVYFYQMTGWTDDGKEIFIDTKKMLMIK